MYFPKRIGFLAVFACYLAVVCWGQAPTGQIAGTITDSSGALVPSVNVTLTHPSTNTKRSTSSNQAGIYSFPALLPGTYELTVEKPGFQSETRSGVELQVGQVVGQDFSLKVGNV